MGLGPSTAWRKPRSVQKQCVSVYVLKARATWNEVCPVPRAGGGSECMGRGSCLVGEGKLAPCRNTPSEHQVMKCAMSFAFSGRACSNLSDHGNWEQRRRFDTPLVILFSS